MLKVYAKEGNHPPILSPPNVIIRPGIDWARGVTPTTTNRINFNNADAARLHEIFRGYFDSAFVELNTFNVNNHRTIYSMYRNNNVFVQLNGQSIFLESLRKVHSGRYSLMSLLESGLLDRPFGTYILPVSRGGTPVYGRVMLTGMKILLPVEVRERVTTFEIAYYIPELKSLFTSNWAGSTLAINFVRDVIRDDLIEKLHLDKTVKRVRMLVPVTVRLGCDPEFEIMLSNRDIVRADDTLALGHRSTSGKIGTDGSGMQIEFRPSPGSPDDVIAELESLFDQYYRTYPTQSLCVSGHTYPLGGHVHVGIDRQVEPTRDVLKLLDDFVGEPTINLSGQARGTYRQLSYHESKRWGFEYRTPPAMIFYNPTLARITLKLIRNLIDRYINVKKDIRYHRPVTQIDLVEVGELTENEARYYLNKLNHLKELMRTGLVIEAKWGKNVNAEESKFIATFSDDWLPIIKTNFIDMLQTMFKTIKHKKTLIYLNFFGFKSERGMISNIKITGLEMSPIKDVVLANGTIAIGLPFLFRTDVAVYSRMKNNVMEGVKRFLTTQTRKRLKDFNITEESLWPTEQIDNEDYTVLKKRSRTSREEYEDEEEDDEIHGTALIETETTNGRDIYRSSIERDVVLEPVRLEGHNPTNAPRIERAIVQGRRSLHPPVRGTVSGRTITGDEIDEVDDGR